MTDLDVAGPGGERGMRLRLGVLCGLALLAVAACTGENIFPLSVARSGGTGLEAPTVEITQPAAEAALNQGDSVQVAASVTSTNGVNQVTLSGSYQNGTAAYVQVVLTLSGATDTTVTRFLQPAGTQTGSARIVVKATDLLGNTGADTVQVTVN